MAKVSAHQKRPVRFVELWDTDPWKVKVYSITEEPGAVEQAYVEIAKSLAHAELSHVRPGHHGVAFVTIHIARQFNQINIDWWARENELRHVVFKAAAETPYDFNNITSTGEAFCVWELAVIAFEREAWMENVLERGRADIEGYLRYRMNENV